MEPATSFWVDYGPALGITFFAFIFAAGAIFARALATLILRTFRDGDPSTVHWTERNRRRFQEAQVSAVLSWSLPLTGLLVLWDSMAATLPERPFVFIGGYFLFRLAVNVTSRWPMRGTEDPAHRTRWEWPGRSTALVLLFTRNFFVAIFGTVLAVAFPNYRFLIAAVTAIVMFTLHSRLGIVFLQATGALRKPSERLQRLVAEIATKLGRPVPPCYEVTGIGLNAMAWPGWQIVGVTRPALKLMDDNDIRALLLHEFGHLAETPAIIGLRSMAAFSSLVFMFGPLIQPLVPGAGALLYLLSFSAFILLSMRFGEGLGRTEDDADKFAATAGGDPIAYARALEKLYHFNGFPAVQSTRRVGLHAELYDRLVAVGAKPDYERPEPPARKRRLVAIAVSTLVFVAFITSAKIGSDEFVRSSASSTTLTLNGWQKFRRGWIFGELARRQSDPELAGRLLDIAVSAEPDEPIYLMNRAMVAAQVGDCGRAGARLMQGVTAFEKQGGIPPKLAMWLQSLHMFINQKCNDGIARLDE